MQTIGPGSPTCAVTVEFLAHLGVRRIVLVGVAGALDATLSTGDVVVVDGAESDEGTSAHYGSHHQPCPTLTGLIGALGSAGSVVTTDAPLRLTQADVDRYRLNAQAIDMELAALFAAGHTVGVSTAGVLVISDRFGEDGWSLGDRGIADDRVADCIDQVLRALEASR